MLNDPNRFLGGSIVSRQRFSWPDDARLAIWVCPNFEHYE
jgi:hypothetical protein